MNDTIKALLKGAGFSKEVIEIVSKDTIPEDFKAEDKISSLHISTREKYFELFKNDEGEDSFRGQIIKETDGKWAGSINTHLKKYGIKSEDVDELKLPDKLKFFADHIKEETSAKFKGGKKDIAKEIEELQEKNLELTNKLTTAEEDRDTKVQEAKDGATKEITQFQTNSSLKNQFSDIPAEQILGKKHSEGLFSAVEIVLNTKYDTFLDDNKTVGFYKKGTTQKAEGEKEGQKVILSTKEVIMQELDIMGFLLKSNGTGDGNPPSTKPIKPDENNKNIIHQNQISAIEKNIDKFQTAD